MYGTIKVKNRSRATGQWHEIEVDFNAYWITIRDESGTVISKYTPNDSCWLDETHTAITKGLDALLKFAGD